MQAGCRDGASIARIEPLARLAHLGFVRHSLAGQGRNRLHPLHAQSYERIVHRCRPLRVNCTHDRSVAFQGAQRHREHALRCTVHSAE